VLAAYLSGMPQRPFEPCIPTRATTVPASKFWIHEVKHDRYRLIVQRDGKTVRLFSRNGHDLTKRYPWIAEAALQNRQQRFVIDGEAVILGVDGVSDFNALHSRQQDDHVQLYAFDILSLDGDDLRKLPLTMRKTSLGYWRGGLMGFSWRRLNKGAKSGQSRRVEKIVAYQCCYPLRIGIRASRPCRFGLDSKSAM
jgi:hypothetical protein